MVLLNKSSMTRVFFTRSKENQASVPISIAPGELYVVPADLESEVDLLVATTGFKQMVDAGFMEVTNRKKDEPLKDAPTPEPPAELSEEKRVEGMSLAVTTNAAAEYDARPKQKVKVVGTTNL